MQRPTIPRDELIAHLFGADSSALASDVGAWLVASPRFRLFAETYRDKIRKKARGVRDDEGRRDLSFELAIALRLLGERRFTLEYEPYGMTARAPDFRVTFRTHLRFNVEVRRVRPAPRSDPAADQARVIRAVCDKLGQLPSAMINLVVLGVEGATPAGAIDRAMLWLQDRAADKDELVFQQRGFAGARDFLRRYQRLSAALWVPGQIGTLELDLWRNPQARHPLPVDLATALKRSMSRSRTEE